MSRKPTYQDLEKRIAELEKKTSALKLNEKIAENEEKYRSLVENIPDVIYSLDKSFKVSAVNLPSEKFYGYKKSEVLGKDFSVFMHPDDQERVFNSFLEAIETKREWTRNLQFRGISKDGNVYWLEVNSHMQFDENGNYKREEGVIRDITDRKNAEIALQDIHNELEERIEDRTKELLEANKKLSKEIKERIQVEKALKDSEERLNIMFEYAPDAYFLNSPDRILLDGNRAAEKLTGYTKKELIGKDVAETGLLPMKQLSQALSHFKKMKKGSTVGPIEYTVSRKDKTKVYVEINTYPVRIKDEDIFLGIARDITERKKAEEKLMKLHEELEKRVEKRTKDLAKSNKELEEKTINLKEANTALKVLLKRREEDQTEVEEKILANVNELIVPAIDTLKGTKLDHRQSIWVEILETNLRDIVSPFSHGLSSKYWKLTPMEFQVANFIKNGKTTKEIAGLLHVATSTINTYRDNIRKKLRIKNKKINLKTYLSDMG
jgi:PAS domain S-box-containing protein